MKIAAIVVVIIMVTAAKELYMQCKEEAQMHSKH